MTAPDPASRLGTGTGRAPIVVPPHLALARAARAGAQPVIHPLRVCDVRRMTEDSVTVSFAVPPTLAAAFRFRAGQHVTVIWERAREEIRRSYSICVPEGTAPLTIGIRQIPDGVFSTHANQRLQPGDILRVMTPTGRFVATPVPGRQARYVAIAAGSGITPILSIVATTLAVEQSSHVVLLYQNRTEASTMFRAELEQLQKRYGDRLEVLHAFSHQRDKRQTFNGMLDRKRLQQFTNYVELRGAPGDVHEWFLCGPVGLMDEVAAVLLERGIQLSRIKRELFFDPAGGEGDESLKQQIPPITSAVTIRAGGRESQFELESRGESILSAAIRVRPDIPYSCQDGVCATCRAKVVSGQALMLRNSGLDKAEQQEGYVLTCQAHPLTPTLLLDFDA